MRHNAWNKYDSKIAENGKAVEDARNGHWSVFNDSMVEGKSKKDQKKEKRNRSIKQTKNIELSCQEMKLRMIGKHVIRVFVEAICKMKKKKINLPHECECASVFVCLHGTLYKRNKINWNRHDLINKNSHSKIMSEMRVFFYRFFFFFHFHFFSFFLSLSLFFISSKFFRHFGCEVKWNRYFVFIQLERDILKIVSNFNAFSRHFNWWLKLFFFLWTHNKIEIRTPISSK